MDEIARTNRETFAREKREGKPWTIPWLDLGVAAFKACRDGTSDALPEPFGNDPVDRMMMSGVNGKRVLCLAGGGGQQSAVFSLLGAQVTVFDLTPEQLEGDAHAAAHYGYPVSLIQGDMRDLSSLPAGHFEHVYQPISTLYVPDLREVYAGVWRVLKPGGLYSSDYTFPLLCLANHIEWDGQAYRLQVASPYRRGTVLENEASEVSLSQGSFIGEFHHLLSDILNGLIETGFTLKGVWENPRPGQAVNLDELEPGSEAHRNQFLPFGISVIAEKCS